MPRGIRILCDDAGELLLGDVDRFGDVRDRIFEPEAHIQDRLTAARQYFLQILGTDLRGLLTGFLQVRLKNRGWRLSLCSVAPEQRRRRQCQAERRQTVLHSLMESIHNLAPLV